MPLIRKNFTEVKLFFIVFGLWTSVQTTAAQQANIWHLPTGTQDGIPSTMRDPATPSANQTVSFYQGVWKGDGAEQAGGYLVYRVNGGAWQSINPPAYAWFANAGSGQSANQFWKASLTMPNTTGAVVEYYFIADFSNRSRTFIYSGNQLSTNEVAAQTNPYVLTIAPPKPIFLVNGSNGDYSKSNFFIDENNDTAYPVLQIRIKPGSPATQVEVFTNLNNRDRANNDYNGDGIEDGILPPNGNNLTTSDTSAYFQAISMVDNNNDGTYELDIPVQKTGAYRITARYRDAPSSPWVWLGSTGIRDHAVIVAPKIAKEIRVYELHVTNANASSASFDGRGTLEDLTDPKERVNLTWLQNLGINWIWFQPIHPQGVEGRQTDSATGNAYDPGSPYAIRNFWEINPLYTRKYNGNLSSPVSNNINYLSGMEAFQEFAFAADEVGVSLMLDFPFNHTAPDVVLGNKGIEIFAPAGNPAGWSSSDRIRDRVPGFFSTDGTEGVASYSAPSQNAAKIAMAPDRSDFGKWTDVRDVFFGRYAALVTGDPSPESSRAMTRQEGDWMDYNGMSTTTIRVWRYFGEVLPYWITKSGHRGYNSSTADGSHRDALDAKGIDGLRKDFGQGLPPQAMEYIINRTHEAKWNFVFMSESLDGEQVTYRSSRHFPLLNENIVFPLQSASTSSHYREIVEARKSAYGQSLVLLNNTSHDERPFDDPWQAFIRYGIVSMMEGAPMIMYGQEIGSGQKIQESQPQGGFTWYEENFEKFIPHFKKWNSLSPQWAAYDNNSFGIQHLLPSYSAVGQARAVSHALRSPNQWFLNPINQSNSDPDISAVAKYTDSFTPLSQQEVVLGFFSLDRNNAQANTFGISAEVANLLGIQNGRTYNAKNIAAYEGRTGELKGRRNQWLWGSGFSRTQILSDGIYVSLNPVPRTEAAWATAPFEAQYLRIYDVTAPTSTISSVSGENPFPYSIGNRATFSWEPAAPEAGVIPHYQVEIWIDGQYAGTRLVDSPSITLENLNLGSSVAIRVITVNPNKPDNTGPSSPSGVSQTTKIISPTGDDDGDGMQNAAEQYSGTNPLDPHSTLKLDIGIINGNTRISWQPVSGKTYRLEYKDNLTQVQWNTLTHGQATGEYTDSGTQGQRFYRVVVE